MSVSIWTVQPPLSSHGPPLYRNQLKRDFFFRSRHPIVTGTFVDISQFCFSVLQIGTRDFERRHCWRRCGAPTVIRTPRGSNQSRQRGA